MALTTLTTTLAVLVSATYARADDGWGDHYHGWGGDHGDNPWGSSDGGNSANGSPSAIGAQVFGSTRAYNRYNTILIAHATMASLVWVVFVPWGAILLRLNLKSPWVLPIHAAIQVLSYFIYIAAAGLGVWLVTQAPGNLWRDVHPRLGLAILAIAFFQPIFGYLHHHIFKRRTADIKANKPTKPPGRTTLGRIHLWVGRGLIILGIVNGGLGIRLASRSPFQTDATTRKAAIAYGMVAAAIFSLYAILVVVFELRRRRVQRNTAAPLLQHHSREAKLPTYDESEGSASSRSPNREPRYQ